MANKVTMVGMIGNPGQTACATFSPLDRGDCVEVCKLVQSELIDLISEEYNLVVYNGKTVVHNGVPVVYELPYMFVVHKGQRVKHNGIDVVYREDYISSAWSIVKHDGKEVVYGTKTVVIKSKDK